MGREEKASATCFGVSGVMENAWALGFEIIHRQGAKGKLIFCTYFFVEVFYCPIFSSK